MLRNNSETNWPDKNFLQMHFPEKIYRKHFCFFALSSLDDHKNKIKILSTDSKMCFLEVEDIIEL